MTTDDAVRKAKAKFLDAIAVTNGSGKGYWNNKQAIEEGWVICRGWARPPIQRIEPGQGIPLTFRGSLIEGDAAALEFVKRRADAGSRYHQTALVINQRPRDKFSAVLPTHKEIYDFINSNKKR